MGDTKTNIERWEKLKSVEAALSEAQKQTKGLAIPTLEYIINMALLEVAEEYDRFE